MRSPLALTGPPGAAVYEWDGFRELEWPPLWCTTRTGPRHPQVIRTRHWAEPVMVGELLVAAAPLVVRHLGTDPAVLRRQSDRISARDRVELAVEHALRAGAVTLEKLRTGGGGRPGDVMLREVLKLRGDEPATESYAETRGVQLLRALGYGCWRQMRVMVNSRAKHRVDLVVPFRQGRPRPEVLRPADGLLIEVDSRQFHLNRFEEDHQRDCTYDELSFHRLNLTPTQIERHPTKVRRAVEGAFRRSGHHPYGH